MTVTYRDICLRLASAGIDSADWDARLLMEHFLGTRAAEYFLSPTLQIDPSVELEAAIEQRAARYPLQYIIGTWDFYRQTYEVSPDCLIPRSDTETLVEEAIRRLPPRAYFADLCTGSGCIAISTLAERPDTTAIAVDKFERTLAIASRNAIRNRVSDRIELRLGDVLEPDFLGTCMQLDAILCNPPYIRTEVLASLAPELNAEPAAALDGGADGLIFYESLLKNGAKYLKPCGFFLFEIGYDQADDLCRLGKEYGFDGIEILRDLGGNDRVARLWRVRA